MKGHVLWHIFQEAALATFRNKRKQKLILEYILKTCWKKLCLQMCCVYSLPPCLSFLLLKAQKDLCVWNLSSGRMEVFALCPSLVRGGRNEFRQIQTCMFSTLGYLLTFSLWGWWKMIDEIKTSSCLWETSELAVYGGQQAVQQMLLMSFLFWRMTGSLRTSAYPCEALSLTWVDLSPYLSNKRRKDIG